MQSYICFLSNAINTHQFVEFSILVYAVDICFTALCSIGTWNNTFHWKTDQIPEKSFGGMYDECEALDINHKQYKSVANITATQSNFKIGLVYPKTKKQEILRKNFSLWIWIALSMLFPLHKQICCSFSVRYKICIYVFMVTLSFMCKTTAINKQYMRTQGQKLNFVYFLFGAERQHAGDVNITIKWYDSNLHEAREWK